MPDESVDRIAPGAGVLAPPGDGVERIVGVAVGVRGGVGAPSGAGLEDPSETDRLAGGVMAAGGGVDVVPPDAGDDVDRDRAVASGVGGGYRRGHE